MENNGQKDSIKNKVLGKIEADKVKMKPKAVFVFKIAGCVAIIVLLVFLAIFLISFNFYVNRFPWGMILIFLVVILAIEALMHRFEFSYRKPIIYTLLLVLLIVVLSGFFLHMTPFHSMISCFCSKNSVPIIGDLYEKYEQAELPDECGCDSCDYLPRKLK